MAIDVKIRDSVPSFLSYLQKRMDFIAQVATSAPSWCLVTSCDELIDHFNKQYCLIKNIIRSHQGAKSGLSFEPVFNKTYDPKGGAPDVDIPHGQIGGQAFYTILENIVRNAAKYGDAKQLEAIMGQPGGGRLQFTISVRDNWDKDGTGWEKDFYQVKIVDHLLTEDSWHMEEDVVTKLNGFLGQHLTDKATGVVMPKYWGMKEIKICSAYLRMVKQDQIDEKFDEWNKGDGTAPPPMIKVSLENTSQVEGRRKGNLTYTLYLLRPKRALVVAPSPPDSELFRRAGVEFWSPEEFRRQIDKGESPRHGFLLLPKPASNDEWDWLAGNLNHLPPRVILQDCQEADIPAVAHRGRFKRSLAFMPGPLMKAPAQLVHSLQECWVNRWWGDFKILVRWSLHKDTVAEQGCVENDQRAEEILARSPGKWLVFDHQTNSDATTLFRAAAYHDTFNQGSPLANLLEKQGRSRRIRPEQMTAEMLESRRRLYIKEAAALSVAIIDERVWLEKDGAATEGVKKYGGAARSRIVVWRKRRVFVQDTNHALRNFSEFVDTLAPPDRNIFDFIIIHQGIIDGVRDRVGEKFLEKWDSLRRKARWVVVDSGRGQPEQARADDLRWIEYSNLAECLIQHAGDKFRLAELLWTLRASSRTGGPK